MPRFLIRCKNRKTQHLWKFGCDVEISGKNVKKTGTGDCIFVNKNNSGFIGGRKGRPRIYDKALVENVSLILTPIPEQ